MRVAGALILGAWLALTGALCSASALPSGVPASPQEPVTDLAGLLSTGTQQRLDQALRAQWQAGHFQLAILTLPSLQDRPIEDVSIQVARAWGLGGKETDNGVLLLVARDERKLRIEVGQKLEGTLTDIACSRIINDVMKPSLRRGDYDRAVLDAAASITALVAPEDPLAAQAPKAPADPTAGLPWPLALALGLLFFLLKRPLLLLLAFVVLQGVLGRLFGRALGRGPRGRGGWGGGFGGGGFGGGSSGGFGGGGGGFSGGGSSGGW